MHSASFPNEDFANFDPDGRSFCGQPAPLGHSF
jgi:hypothetical protein